MRLIKKNNYDFNVWKLTFIKLQINFSAENYRRKTKEYFEKQINLNKWNLKVLVHIIPFIFGISNMIFSRYKEQSINSFIGGTLPGTKTLQEEISWETIKNLKGKNLNKNRINKIDFSYNYCIINFENCREKNSVGIIQKNQKIKFSQIGNNNYKLPIDEYFHLFSKNINNDKLKAIKNKDFYYQLDELPLKLEKNNTYNLEMENNSIFSTKLNYLLEDFFYNKKSIKVFKNRAFIPVFFLDNNSSSSTQRLKKTFHNEVFFLTKDLIINGFTLNKKNEIYRENKTLKKTKNKSWLIKKNILKNELELFFYNEGIVPNIIEKKLILQNNKEKNVKELYFLEYSSTETLDLLYYFLELSKNNIAIPKKISGYIYPDISKKNVLLFGLNKSIKKLKNNFLVKINLPSNYLNFFNDDYSIFSNCSGPLIISNRKDSFFGENLEKENTNLGKITSFIFEEKNKKNTEIVNDLNDLDYDSWFLSLNEKKPIIINNFEEYYSSRFIKNTIQIENLYNKKKLLQDSALPLERELAPGAINSTKIKYNFIPFTESFLKEKSLLPTEFGNVYKKIPTFFKFVKNKSFLFEKSKFQFFEGWEPVSSMSWMIITQISFCLFVLHLLNDLYKDYGKELVAYILQLASLSGINVDELKENYLYEDPGYRLIKKVKKNFKDIAGIDNILLQLGEIVWFLRNAGRSSKFRNASSNGILLTGPPGTGKTLLVQVIAGEAEVPILIESASLLTNPQQTGKGSGGVEKLKKLFDEARSLAPCIVFIDEIDTLGEKRQNIIQTTMGSNELIESIYENKSINNLDFSKTQTENFLPTPQTAGRNLNEDTSKKDMEYNLFENDFQKDSNSEKNEIHSNLETKEMRVSLLTQFLIELDGLKARNGIIVIGATNRLNVLDPALIRPGRFDKILKLELPGKQKRIEILKLYAKKFRIKQNISWDYLAKRTRGFSAADLATVMNESTIQSILAKTNQTVETVERGIDLVTSYNFDKNISNNLKKSKDPFYLSRLAYYQSGKVVVQSMIKNHPSMVVFHLWPRPKNTRYSNLNEKNFLQMTNRLSLEAQLIGFYGGKASEILALSGNKIKHSLKRWHSDYGFDDLVSGNLLANLLVEKWFFYSVNILIRKNNQLVNNRNEKVFTEIEKLQLSKTFENEIEDEIEIKKISKLNKLGPYQQRGFGPWWQIQVAKQTSEINSFFSDWYRVYLPDPEENILNLEWIPPDEYYHSNESLKNISKKTDISYKDLYKIERDYVFQGLLLNSFNSAFSFLENKREFLDYFANYLLRFEILRENNIKKLIKNSKIPKALNKEKDFKSKYKIIENFWGENSRRKTSRSIKI